MADEQYKWLNRVTADRLLRGESLEAVEASARDQAERLAGALGELSARVAPATTELPGEEAALAAFRKARESAEDAGTVVAAQSGGPGRDADAGLFRIAAGARPARVPRRFRPARLGLAAALTAGMLGGIAVAAGTGVLPTPFDDNRPGPAASVSAAGTPARPQGSQSPDSLPGGETGTPSSHAASGGSGQNPPGSTGKPKTRDTASPGLPVGGWSGALTSCRAIQGGKSLDTERRRALEGLAGGAGRVDKFCKAVLGTGLNGKGEPPGDGKGGDNGQGGQDDGNGSGGDDEGWPGRGAGGTGGTGWGRGDHHHQDGVATPAPTGFAPLPQSRSATSPSPTYSAL